LLNFSEILEYSSHQNQKIIKNDFLNYPKKPLIINDNLDISFNNEDSNISTKLIDVNHMSSDLMKLMFTKYIKTNIKNLIISIMLLKNIILINIPSNTIIDFPISFLNHLYSPNTVSSNYVFINIGENSNINFYQENKSESKTINSNIIHMVLEKNVTLEYTNIQYENNTAYSFNSMILEQGYNSKFTFNNICTSGNFFFNNINIHQNEPYSYFSTNWANIGNSNQNIYDVISVNHNSDYGTSIEQFKGIYYDNSSRILENIVNVKENTNYIKSHQISENLIISSNAYIRILPAMKIYSDNIQCTHGVVIDTINENFLFYMCSRGLSKKIANNIIIISFIKSILNNIRNKYIKKIAWNYIKNKLQNIFI
jgi:Fe-S cluster assembly protein SufD